MGLSLNNLQRLICYKTQTTNLYRISNLTSSMEVNYSNSVNHNRVQVLGYRKYSLLFKCEVRIEPATSWSYLKLSTLSFTPWPNRNRFRFWFLPKHFSLLIFGRRWCSLFISHDFLYRFYLYLLFLCNHLFRCTGVFYISVIRVLLLNSVTELILFSINCFIWVSGSCWYSSLFNYPRIFTILWSENSPFFNKCKFLFSCFKSCWI